MDFIGLAQVAREHPVGDVSPHLEPDKPVAHQALHSEHARVGESLEKVKHMAAQCRGV